VPASRLIARITAAWLSRGPLAISLLPVAALYGALTALRRALYNRGWLTSQPIAVPVLVVGNRVAGGAGKTPTTIAIVNHLRSQGWRVGVVSRGHGSQAAGVQALSETATAAQVGDEPLLIWRRTGGVPVVVGKDRVAAAQSLLAAHPDTDLIICDDGLQHLRLARDIEVIVFDERGQGNGWLLPAGPLREPVNTPAPAGLCAAPIVLYNAEQPSTDLHGHCVTKGTAPLLELNAWWHGRRDCQPPPLTPDNQGPEPVWAVAGIAQPDRFFQQLTAQGWRIHGHPMADHADLSTLPWPESVTQVIVTEKDAVKLSPDEIRRQRPHTTVWVAALDYQPAPSFWLELDQALGKLPKSHPKN